MHKNPYVSKKIPPKIIFWGGTGQAIVSRPLIEIYGSELVAVFDDTHGLQSLFPDVKVYCGWEEFKNWIEQRNRNEIGFCICIGNPHGHVRLRLHDSLINEGLSPITIAHPTAWVDKNAVIGAGTQILEGAIIHPNVKIGRECIINPHVIVAHECTLEEGVEIGPGATLNGLVQVGANTWVGSGAVILPRIKVGADAIVGAGAIVMKDVPAGVTVIGNPARPIIKK